MKQLISERVFHEIQRFPRAVIDMVDYQYVLFSTVSTFFLAPNWLVIACSIVLCFTKMDMSYIHGWCVIFRPLSEQKSISLWKTLTKTSVTLRFYSLACIWAFWAAFPCFSTDWGITLLVWATRRWFTIVFKSLYRIDQFLTQNRYWNIKLLSLCRLCASWKSQYAPWTDSWIAPSLKPLGS